jgi:RAB protein geranylgeranyltransferase component A
MKFDTETYYESERLINKLKKLPNVKEVILDNNKLLLISKRNNRLIEIVQSITVETLILENITYIRLNDMLSLLSLSNKTRPEGNNDEMHLIGKDDEDEE